MYGETAHPSSVGYYEGLGGGGELFARGVSPTKKSGLSGAGGGSLDVKESISPPRAVRAVTGGRSGRLFGLGGSLAFLTGLLGALIGGRF